MQHKFFRNQIMSPLLQGLYNSIKLLIIKKIFPFCIIQLLTKESNNFSFLTSYRSTCTTTCITFYLKYFIKIRQSQNRKFGNLMFQSFKTLVCSMCPLEILFVSSHSLSHRITNNIETPYKLSIQTSQTMK